MIFGINTTSDISKMLHVIETILKYHECCEKVSVNQDRFFLKFLVADISPFLEAQGTIIVSYGEGVAMILETG